MALEYSDAIAGPLLVKSLASDAWEKWCKDGVVCFGYTSRDYELLKIYFANPRDQSVYHVTDFQDGQNQLHTFILIGSTIYVLLGTPNSTDNCPVGDAYCDVHYCDVRQPLPDGGFEWKLGPKLNTHKHRPLLFSLAGNLYVLSTYGFHPAAAGGHQSNCAPFEFLKPDGGDKWQVLPCPEYLQHQQIIGGSLVLEDGKNRNRKLLLHSLCLTTGIYSFIIYDAEFNVWSRLSLRFDEHYGNLQLSDTFGVDDIGLLLCNRSQPSSFVLCNFGQTFEGCLVEPMFRGRGLDLNPLIRVRADSVRNWDLVSFGTSGLCFIGLCYADDEFDYVHVRIWTCDSSQQSDHESESNPNPKRAKTDPLKRNDLFKTINIAKAGDLWPMNVSCSILGL